MEQMLSLNSCLKNEHKLDLDSNTLNLKSTNKLFFEEVRISNFDKREYQS